LIRVWQAPDFEQETIVQNPFETDFDSFFIDDTGKRLFLRPHYGNEMTILDVATSKPIAVLQNVEDVLNRSADGRLLAISRSDYSVTIYDTQLNQTLQTLPSHTSDVIAACFSPTESIVATITNNGKITFWALDPGEMLIQFQAAFSNKLTKGACLAFSAKGHTLAASGGIVGEKGDHFTELRVWQVP
jgi:WD40 repeat protein